MIEYEYIEDTTEALSLKAYNEMFRVKISEKGTLIMSFKLTVERY